MLNPFNKILVLADPVEEKTIAVEKALQLANLYSCDLHLLYITSLPRNFFYRERPSVDAAHEMKRWQSYCRNNLAAGLQFSAGTCTRKGLQQQLRDNIIRHRINLLVLAHKKQTLPIFRREQPDLNRICKETNCAVLSVTEEFNARHLERILVPIYGTLPVKKLSIASFLSKQNTTTIHLMGKDHPLLKAYQLLRDHSDAVVHCNLGGKNPDPGATLDYARHIHADLIVIDNGRESLAGGWWARLMKKYLYRVSGIPVLTVSSIKP